MPPTATHPAVRFRMKVHLIAQHDADASWCGTRHNDIIVSPSWDDVTCERCAKEVGRRRRAEHQAMLAERVAAQRTLFDPRHPAAPPSNVIDLDEYRSRRRAAP